MAQMVELAERGDFAAARAMHRAAAADAGQLHRVEPRSREGRDGGMGLLEPVYRLPMVPPRRRRARGSSTCCARSGLLEDR
jgi:hypothetical protein